MKLYYTEISSPVGSLKLIAHDHALTGVVWQNDQWERFDRVAMAYNPEHPIIKTSQRQLNEYFSRKRIAFDIPLDPLGTPFQHAVWDLLKHIAYGSTVSYGQLARTLTKPGAARAVGNAVGKNPLSIIVPCHRVVGSNGSLTGFAGGLTAKQTLLTIETL